MSKEEEERYHLLLGICGVGFVIGITAGVGEMYGTAYGCFTFAALMILSILLATRQHRK
ncbi:MAG TPA: hypothetical protein VKB67_02035 [Rhizomicrobium sp.]|nr:hypothetical protein [Rhizomicrobium sp.]